MPLIQLVPAQSGSRILNMLHDCLCILQVYKKLGENHQAQMYFSWAVDLDPKGANNQIKEAIDKRYLPEDDDVSIDDVDLSDEVGLLVELSNQSRQLSDNEQLE